MTFDPRQLPVGHRIADTKWGMCGLLGEGGMGVVLDVVKDPGIRGAMKMMQPHYAQRPDLVALFLDEIRMTTVLRHQHIVSVIDADRLPDGTPFVVTERLEGITLRKALRKMRGRGLPPNLAHLINTQICDALLRAHSHTTPVVHRDLKPENIFLHQPPYEPPMVKVLDWGVAALLDGKQDTRGTIGTPAYMAPEQLRGEPASPLVDIYAVGLMLYEMLTGRLPWDIDYSRQDHVRAAHLSMPPIPPSRFAPWIPPRVDAHLLGALAKNPADRPRSAYAFASEFYELQFIDDGAHGTVDVNTTVLNLAAVIDLSDGEGAQSGTALAGDATSYGMTPPPIDGRSIELVGVWDVPPPPRAATVADSAPQPRPGTIPTGVAMAPQAFGARGPDKTVRLGGTPERPQPWAFVGPVGRSPSKPPASVVVVAPRPRSRPAPYRSSLSESPTIPGVRRVVRLTVAAAIVMALVTATVGIVLLVVGRGPRGATSKPEPPAAATSSGPVAVQPPAVPSGPPSATAAAPVEVASPSATASARPRVVLRPPGGAPSAPRPPASVDDPERLYEAP
jgi:hypothetical protein